MGQYYKGVKIGTCESMHYMRLSEAKKLAEGGARDDDGILFEEYLTDNVTRFRFPFPDEDEKQVASLLYLAEFDRGFNLPAGDVKISHGTICVSNSFKGAGNNMNILLPCPHSQEFKDMGIKVSVGGAGEQFLVVLYQAMRSSETGEKKEKTIFACARCGVQQRLSDEDVEKVRVRSREYFEVYDTNGKSEGYIGDQNRYDNAMEILNRIK